MTSINSSEWPSRPPVGAWLHGDETDASPETFVAWRNDVENLADPDSAVTESDLEDVFDCYRVLAQERLKQCTETLCTKRQESDYLNRLAILIAADGKISTGTLENLLKAPLNDSDMLPFSCRPVLAISRSTVWWSGREPPIS